MCNLFENNTSLNGRLGCSSSSVLIGEYKSYLSFCSMRFFMPKIRILSLSIRGQAQARVCVLIIGLD